jgi:hypothetical protein
MARPRLISQLVNGEEMEFKVPSGYLLLEIEINQLRPFNQDSHCEDRDLNPDSPASERGVSVTEPLYVINCSKEERRAKRNAVKVRKIKTLSL